ncbi:MAG TPA: serine/threonine protein kinase, partial [Azospirillaceae bacterium]|nr:serine/threonine protein kinase [Azospirillaceae bacterium]
MEEAELCSGLPDYYALPSRIVMGVVFRSYLDSMVLTPFEIAHNHKLLRGLLEQTTLVENAMIRVSTVQARLPGQEAKARKAALQNAANEMASRAWSAQSAFNAAPKGRSVVDWLLDQPDGHSPTGDGHFDLCVALAADLAEHRTWAAKIDRIIDLLRSDRAEGRLLPILDSALADVLGSGAALQEILNTPAATQGELLVGQCRLVLGTTASVGMTGPSREAVLNGVFRQGRVPYARAAVIDRVRRQLRSPAPLGRGTSAQEADYLRDAMAFLLAPTGVVGGAGMAEAVTLRYSRRLEQGGASAFRRSLIGVCEMQADLFSRVNYLAAVSRCAAAERHQAEIIDALEAALGNELLIESAVLQGADVSALRGAIDAMRNAIRAAALPEETKAKLCGRAEHAVDVYVQHGRMIQRLKQLEPHLRRRAIRMAELACSGLVRENGGMPILRQSIMEIVRQPEFQNDVKGPQNSELAQIEVRRLYDLLDLLMQNGQATSALPRPSAPPAPIVV